MSHKEKGSRGVSLNLDEIGDRTAERAMERWNSLGKDFDEDDE